MTCFWLCKDGKDGKTGRTVGWKDGKRGETGRREVADTRAGS
jgi:hypothetical protein